MSSIKICAGASDDGYLPGAFIGANDRRVASRTVVARSVLCLVALREKIM